MANDQEHRACTIVLHENSFSQDSVLCGSNVALDRALGYLSAPGAKTLCVSPHHGSVNLDEVSIHVSLARIFGFENRMKAVFTVLEDDSQATATHVELMFRDQHLSRADMWRIKMQVDDCVLHEGQKLRYLGSVVANVEAIYISGHKVRSAYVLHPRTKLIFRSGSARFTLLIQISGEMLQKWANGDLMWERLVFGLLPCLFRRWTDLKVRHHISVVFFGRRNTPRTDALHHGNESADEHRLGENADDFYQVLELDLQHVHWRELVFRIRRAFNRLEFPQNVCTASKGNMLHAIHLAAMDFARHHVDLRLASTGSSIVAITAGTGMFEADHDLLKRTTSLLMGNSIGVDVIALSPRPLHPIPLFHYTRQDAHEYALPHWIDMSYWPSDGQQIKPKWLMPESIGSVLGIALPLCSYHQNPKSSVATKMDLEDDSIFLKKSSPKSLNSEQPFLFHTGNESAIPDSRPRPIDQTDDAVDSKAISDASRKEIEETRKEHASKDRQGPPKNRAHKKQTRNESNRKISLGPRGLALSKGTASTTISAQNAQQERESSLPVAFASNAASSGIAKQIRESLARKPSQQSLNSRPASDYTVESLKTTKPIKIHQREHNEEVREDDPATVMESTVLAQGGEQSLSATPKGQRDSLPLPGMNALEDNNGSISPWLTLLNPCNPRRDNMRIASEYRMWQHAFPRPITAEDFKWDSLCNPATLPLMTEYRITSAALEKHFNKKVRRLVAKSVPGIGNTDSQRVLFELIRLRLRAGFQIVPRRTVGRLNSNMRQLDRALLSLGNVYHHLACVSTSEVQIIEYDRIRDKDSEAADSGGQRRQYTAHIQPESTSQSQLVHVILAGAVDGEDWSSLDEQSINSTALAEGQGSMIVRFVLLPISFNKIDHTSLLSKGLTDDEIRIEGIQKLTQLWQRHRYMSEDDQRNHRSMIRARTPTSADRDPNPLAVEYHTSDPSHVVRAHDPLATDDTADGEQLPPLSAATDLYHTSDFDVAKLAKHLQEPPPEGIELKDRWWLTKLHLRCFRGDEMTNWLLRVFKDLQTREDAVQLGNQLKEIGIFSHVRSKHEFKDGHYFYQIKSAYRTSDYPDSAGIFGKAIGRSVPPTPMSETKQSALLRPAREGLDNMIKGLTTPILQPVDKKEVLLSQKIQYNVDFNKKSTSLEVVNLHYDRIHNPDNCFHIQLDWTNTTAKLIRECVSRWVGLVESHGLKLVQVPVHEAVRLPEYHPFDQPIPIKLVVRPPVRNLHTPRIEPQNSSPKGLDDAEGFHKAVLRKLDYVLDFEAARHFPSKIQARYSWGTPHYTSTQFVHKSGLVLVQIINNEGGDFSIVPNRLALHATTVPGKRPEEMSTCEIIKRLQHFCRDEQALKNLYQECTRKPVSTPSPLANAALTADGEIPPFQLPPLTGKKS